MTRDEILEKAADLITAGRDEVYGEPRTNHQRIADLWSTILGVDIDIDEVILCMIAVKMSRLMKTPEHEDSWVDIAGYAALGGEITSNE